MRQNFKFLTALSSLSALRAPIQASTSFYRVYIQYRASILTAHNSQLLAPWQHAKAHLTHTAKFGHLRNPCMSTRLYTHSARNRRRKSKDDTIRDPAQSCYPHLEALVGWEILYNESTRGCPRLWPKRRSRKLEKKVQNGSYHLLCLDDKAKDVERFQ